jgi:23S rRNA pseudouridine1911/1915/1917 synthase
MKILNINCNDLINIRLDKAVFDYCNSNNINITRTRVQNLIKDNYFKKNNEIFNNISYKIKVGDILVLNVPNEEKQELKASSIPIDIIYDDDDVLVINKQAGLITHPGAGNCENTLANALLNLYGKNLSNIGGKFRPGIVHRLDKDTTGLMVVAKNNKAHKILAEQLKNRTLSRNYIGILWGVLSPRKGKIEGYIERSKNNRLKMELVKDGRYSRTNYQTLKTFLNSSLSMVDFKLDTGRTHQIRVHCNSKNCPLIGDKLYGGKSKHLKSNYKIKDFVDNFSRQALHSYKISFCQPTTNEIKIFEIPLAKDMKELLNNLK